jgi:hypothetical protein
VGEGWRESERERERGGELTSGSKSGDHRLQNLGHNGEEREVEERKLLRGRIELGKERQREGARMGRSRAPRARGQGRAGPGWATPRDKNP